MKILLRLLVRWLFRFRAYNEAVLKAPGPVLLIPNHQTLIDWLFLGVCLDEDWRVFAARVAAQTNWRDPKTPINRRTFLVHNTSPHSLQAVAGDLQDCGRPVVVAQGPP